MFEFLNTLYITQVIQLIAARCGFLINDLHRLSEVQSAADTLGRVVQSLIRLERILISVL